MKKIIISLLIAILMMGITGCKKEPIEKNIEIDITKNNRENANTERNGKYSDKTVYLTFDDGPSENTEEILDILDKYNVKASFFVVGKEDSYSLNMYKEIVKRGHTLGMHSYSHKYDYIYESFDNFFKDYNKIFNLLYDTTGVKPSIYRFPGGSLNDVSNIDIESIIKYFNSENIVYYDWNVLNGDAEIINYTDNELIDNVISGIEINNSSIVLMHDSEDKYAKVRTLPVILEKLISEGEKIAPLDKNSPKIQMVEADSIK